GNEPSPLCPFCDIARISFSAFLSASFLLPHPAPPPEGLHGLVPAFPDQLLNLDLFPDHRRSRLPFLRPAFPKIVFPDDFFPLKHIFFTLHSVTPVQSISGVCVLADCVS